MLATISQFRSQLESQQTSARSLVEFALEKATAAGTDAAKAFLSLAPERALTEADSVDRARAAGAGVAPFAGVPFAAKDLFDVAGEITTAGSKVLAGAPAATSDAVAVARMRSAGFILIGRTHMTEFAYSGLGLNSHHPTPRSPWNRAVGHIPGGSSSGSAVAVAEGVVPVALGTDTGGSCRIPAAFCGVVGYKPTASEVPLDGVIELAHSFDSVGPIAGSVVDCAAVHDILAGGSGALPETSTDSFRLGVLQEVVLTDLGSSVRGAFFVALARLRAAGVGLDDVHFPELESFSAGTTIGRYEAYQYHRRMGINPSGYDPRVKARIRAGAEVDSLQYEEALGARRRLIQAGEKVFSGSNILVLPTVAVVPPVLDGLEHDEGNRYRTANQTVLRNTAIANSLDACAITIPLRGKAPVGLTLMARAGSDSLLLAIAARVESLLK